MAGPPRDAVNGHGATIATLETKVGALELGHARIERTILDLDSSFNSSIASLSNDFRSQLSALGNKIEARATTQWPTLIGLCSVIITVLTLVGGMAYLPIQRDTSRLDAAVATIIDKGVFQREYTADELRTKDELRALRVDLSTRITLPRYNADQERTTHSLDEIRNRVATKAEVDAIFKERQRQIDLDTGQIENLRVRTYDHLGKIAKNEQAIVDLERRFDNISRRVIELNNRTMGVQRTPIPN